MNCVQPLPDCNNVNELSNFNTTQDCWDIRQKLTAARIYMIVAIINGICIIITTLAFIYVASNDSSTSKIPTSDLNARQLHQTRKKHSIQQRSVMGTTLGAIGHLIFSSCLLLAQALNAEIGCELILYGVCIGFYTWMFAFCTRAHRLKFMFRLNQLKVKYLRMPSSDRLLCTDDKDYRWYISHKRNIKRTLMKPYIFYGLSLILIVSIGAPIDIYIPGCQSNVGTGLLIGYFGFFILILIPFIFWYLRNNADAHGIRKELWIDAIIGVPLFIVYLTFFFIYQPKALTLQDDVYQLFKPGNWAIIFTAMAHIISVVIPIITYLPIENKTWVHSINYISEKTSLKKSPSSSLPMTKLESKHSNPVDPSAAATTTTTAAVAKNNHISTTTTSKALAEVIPELSIESLEKSLSDPEMMHQLQDLAIRDFSSENILFYEKYLELEAQFKREYTKNDNGNNTHNSWIQTYITRKSANIVQQEDDIITTSKEEGAIEQQQKIERFLTTPIPLRMYPLFIRFYETFIAENTSSQVNISYRARHHIDLAFEIIYQKYPDLNPKMESSSSNRSVLTTLTSRISSYDDPVEKYIKHQDDISEPILNLGTFEDARIEVCWNIFNSVYPKFVSLHHHNTTTTTTTTTNNNNNSPC